jgi:hypothetical protein
MTSDAAETARESIAAIEEFFASIDSNKIFRSRDPAFYHSLRRKLRKAFWSLLIWGRPVLETAHGLMWPYVGLRDRRSVFALPAELETNGFVETQARMFLAFLPFPGQWSEMRRVEERYCDDPEVKDFLLDEQGEILRKIHHKPQTHYKLRHFCQVLKRAEEGKEKGVLRIFSLPYLFTRCGLPAKLSTRYMLFVEPPMGVVFRHPWWRHFANLEDPCIMGVPSAEDVFFLEGQQGVEAVRLAHGDFLEEMDLNVQQTGKEYDIVFNASFDDLERKRHDLMLSLLSHPLLQTGSALFIGRGSGENVEKFKKQVLRHNLAPRVTVLANLRRQDVPPLLDRCRMGVHLSLYENGCRSIYELFRSDLPCVISSSMGGMNLEIFNAETGKAVTDDELPEAISSVLRHAEEYGPRKWFLAHSGSRNSTRELNGLLRGLSERWGYDWRHDIVPLASSGASRYTDTSAHEHFRADFQWILDCLREAAPTSLTFSID